jgi:hypothetical protein
MPLATIDFKRHSMTNNQDRRGNFSVSWNDPLLHYKDLDKSLTLHCEQSSSPMLTEEVWRCGKYHVSRCESL